MNTRQMPGFTAEAALSAAGRDYRRPHLSQAGRTEAVTVALINSNPGGGSNFWCDESQGTCSCLGGWLSDDCWLMGQYCTTGLYCSPYFPYKCTCSYLSQWSPHPRFPRVPVGGISTR